MPQLLTKSPSKMKEKWKFSVVYTFSYKDYKTDYMEIQINYMHFMCLN